MKYCPSCGKEALDDMAFCAACGTPLPKMDELRPVQQVQSGEVQAGAESGQLPAVPQQDAGTARGGNRKPLVIGIVAAVVVVAIVAGLLLAQNARKAHEEAQRAAEQAAAQQAKEDAGAAIDDQTIRNSLLGSSKLMKGAAKDSYVDADSYTLDAVENVSKDIDDAEGKAVVRCKAKLSNDFFSETTNVKIAYAYDASQAAYVQQKLKLGKRSVKPIRGVSHDSKAEFSGEYTDFDSSKRTCTYETSSTSSNWYGRFEVISTYKYAFKKNAWHRVEGTPSTSEEFLELYDVSADFEDERSGPTDSAGYYASLSLHNVDTMEHTATLSVSWYSRYYSDGTNYPCIDSERVRLVPDGDSLRFERISGSGGGDFTGSGYITEGRLQFTGGKLHFDGGSKSVECNNSLAKL